MLLTMPMCRLDGDLIGDAANLGWVKSKLLPTAWHFLHHALAVRPVQVHEPTRTSHGHLCEHMLA